MIDPLSLHSRPWYERCSSTVLKQSSKMSLLTLLRALLIARLFIMKHTELAVQVTQSSCVSPTPAP